MTDYQDFNRVESFRRGIDPAVTEAAWNTEGGLTEPCRIGKFTTGWSFWAPQLVDVPPCLATHDAEYGPMIDSVSLTESGRTDTARVSPTDVSDHFQGESGSAIPLTARMPSLLHHVRMVVRQRSQKQMVGSDASAVIAPMAHVHSCRDIPKVETPRDTVHPVTGKGSVWPSHLNVAVASGLANAPGLPTLVRLDDSAPESRLEVLLSEPPCGIMNMHQITPGAMPSAVDAARGFLVEIIP